VSRLASGLSVTGDDALKALVASGDTSVPGIELSDLNDGDILANTRERVNDQGQMQFVYIPNDGSDPIESDWIQQEHKKKVILGWCEGVKNAIIQRGSAGMHAANAAALEERLRRKREEDMADVEDTQTVAPAKAVSVGVPQPAVSRRTEPVRPGLVASDDPFQYVEDQLDIARERLSAAESAQQDIIREVLAARRAYDKWQTLAQTLSGDAGSDSDDHGSVRDEPMDTQPTRSVVRAPRPNVPSVPTVLTEREVPVQRPGRGAPIGSDRASRVLRL
jgi:hypothetical protein